MDWYQTKPALVAATRAFVALAENWDDPLTSWCASLPSQDQQAAWLLLGCALHQGVSLPALLRLLESLRTAFGDEGLFMLPAPRETELQQACRRACLAKDWELQPQLPGIVWSVGHFIRNRNQALAEWIKASSPRHIWQACGEIHYMGKNSSQRPKALAFLFRLHFPSPAGFGWRLTLEGGTPPLPVSMGARRWLGWIGPWSETDYADAGAAGRTGIIRDQYARLAPDAPWKACHALLFYTEPAGNTYLCATLSGSCERCPLNLECPRRIPHA